MQFHQYINLRNQFAEFGHDDEARRLGKAMKSDEFRAFFAKRCEEDMEHALPGRESHQIFERFCALSAEQTWVNNDRPFYNVWPVVEQLARDVKLDLPFSAVEIPFDSMVLRFARGHEPHKVTTAMLFWPKDWPNTPSNLNVLCNFSGTMDRLTFRCDYDAEETVESWLQQIVSDSESREWRSTEQTNRNADSIAAFLMVRLVVFVGLLANDHDLITPIVLAKDRRKYGSTDDPDTKKWLEERAARRAGRGFDIGKKMQFEKDQSPHWRNPHLCLFWTGPGRKKPIIQMRSGAVIQRVGMTEVPTGYLGPESEADDVLPPTKTPRESIPKTRRFEILKRDEYRCQLCGKSADDDVTLHVDHRVPLAKGGSNEDDNLWTLCETCNLGKADREL